MIEQRPSADEARRTGWRTVARHDFESGTELDATIVTALGDDGCLGDGPLYPVDVESAEQFLASAADASVVFPVSNHTVRVSTDGIVEVRQEAEDADDVGSTE